MRFTCRGCRRLLGKCVSVSAGGAACAQPSTCPAHHALRAALLQQGQNADGVLGDGTTTNRPSPVRVLSAPGRVYVAIATGGTHTCALVAGGSEIDCWGSNELHQLGDGTTNAHWTPVRVQTPPGRAYKALAAGEAHTCALLADGSGADCWGFNGAGQLGIGTYDQPATPVRAHTAPGRVYVGIAAAGEHTCALASDSGADCWVSLPAPACLPACLPACCAACSSQLPAPPACHSWAALCALHGEQGRGAAGQLGDGKVTDSPAPVQVDAPGVKFVSLAAGGDFTIGLAAV